MRNLAKYFLALAVMGTGFYAAQQHRHPNREQAAPPTLRPGSTAETSANLARRTPSHPAPDVLPVAALTDVDRVPMYGADSAPIPLGTDGAKAANVTKQPAVRRDIQAEQSAPAASPLTPATEAAKQGTAKQETRPQDSAPQNAKKTPASNAPTRKQNAKKETPVKTNDNEYQPPDFARYYQPYAARFEAGNEKEIQAKIEPDSCDGDHRENPKEGNSVASASSNDRPPQTPLDAGPRTHRIAEGDTLRRLAEQYLGSRNRYLDIFQANQDVLFDPQLIPIGVEIEIPERTVAVAHAPTDSPSNDGADRRRRGSEFPDGRKHAAER